MTKNPTALDVLEQNVAVLSKRTSNAQREVALCLRWIRIHATRAARAAVLAPAPRAPRSRS